MEKTITDITRRNIIDEIRLSNFSWSGRLSEVDFLDRIFPLDILPSDDSRYGNMRADIYQHRINNYDWDDFWVFKDARLNIESLDKTFLDFLCEMIHPLVRPDNKEVNLLLDIFNKNLLTDGWKIVEKK
jgi:hypothetical protein